MFGMLTGFDLYPVFKLFGGHCYSLFFVLIFVCQLFQMIVPSIFLGTYFSTLVWKRSIAWM